MTNIFKFAFLLFALSGNANACKTLSEQLTHDEPIVKAKLLTLKPGEQLSGIRLCDNSVIFNSWRYVRAAKSQQPFQHILLFRDGRSIRAVVWIESGGKDLATPVCPHGESCNKMPDGATVISGDVYTFNTIRPNGELVVLRYPPVSW